MRAGARRLAAALLALWLGAGLASGGGAQLGFDFDGKPDEHWKLPKRLREISGLAVGPGDRLFAHDDERAEIYEVDAKRGRILKSFRLGEGSGQKADFEGLAIAGERFFLVTSDGRLYESGEAADGESVGFRVHETGLESECEVEGLAYDPGPRELLLACKNVRRRKLRHFVAIHRWSLEREALAGPALLIAESELSKGLEKRDFHPSGIERHPLSGHLFLVAGREGALAEITPSGEVRGRQRLPGRHRQPEGITFLSDGRLVLSDEGEKRRARLSIYAPR